MSTKKVKKLKEKLEEEENTSIAALFLEHQERTLKNEAYAFLISQNLIGLFKAFKSSETYRPTSAQKYVYNSVMKSNEAGGWIDKLNEAETN